MSKEKDLNNTEAPDLYMNGATEEAEAELTPEERIAELEAAFKKVEDDHLRAAADMENVKRRLQREKEDFLKYANEKLLHDFLPVIDNLDLALAHAGEIEACKDFVTGVEMTRKLFLDALAGHGLKAVGEAGEEFNPAFHEAMAMSPEGDMPDNHVSQVVQRGYELNGRVIRPAKVLVKKG